VMVFEFFDRAHEMYISRESVYTVENQQLKCLQNSLHFFQSVYIVGNQQSKCLH
jgi:hypothetical protein